MSRIVSDIKINIIDVGCSDKLIQPWRKYSKNIAFVLGFDVNGIDSYKKWLGKNNVKYNIYEKIVFNEENKKMFFYNRKKLSSLFEINEKLVESYIFEVNKKYIVNKNAIEKRKKDFVLLKIEEKECIRLDSVLDKIDVDFDFIKIDTQGSDFQVLESLGKYIDTQIVAIQTELFFKPLYKNIYLYKDVNKFLKDKGFYKFHRSDYNKWCSDFLYLKKSNFKKEKIDFIKKIYKNKR